MMQLNIPDDKDRAPSVEVAGPGPRVKERVGGQRALRHTETQIIRMIQDDGMAPGTMLPGYQDLALRCGVAPATVQRAIAELSNRGIVRSVSRKGTFVAKTVDSHWGPRHEHSAARLPDGTRFSLVKAPKILTVVVIADIPLEDQEFRDQTWALFIVDGIERAAAADSRVMIQLINLWRSKESHLTPDEALDLLAETKADGQIFIQPGEDLLSEARMRQLPVPATVLVTGEITERPMTQVYYDSTVAGYQAAAHLIDFGYRRLIFASPFNESWVRERLAGVRRAVADAPHTVSLETLVLDKVPSPSRQLEDAAQMAPSVLSKVQPGTAIIGANDGVAHGMARGAADFGLELGRDFGLIGFDDRPKSRELGITSLRPPLEEMGREALRLLRNSLQTQCVTGHLRLASTLTPRPSTRAFTG